MHKVLEIIPRIRSPRWSAPAAPPEAGRLDPRTTLAFFSKDGMRVLVTVPTEPESDGKRHLHVSVSRADRLPSWGDMREVKDAFIGQDRLAFQVFPRQKEYVNVHEYCFHLWHCLDGDPFPSFESV